MFVCLVMAPMRLPVQREIQLLQLSIAITSVKNDLDISTGIQFPTENISKQLPYLKFIFAVPFTVYLLH